MRRIGTVGSAIALAIVGLASGALAATTSQNAVKHTIGIIDSYNAKDGVVDLQIGNTSEKIAIESSTKISDHGRSIQAAELQKGQRVLVDWTAKEGRTIASNVEVLANTSQPAAKKGRR